MLFDEQHPQGGVQQSFLFSQEVADKIEDRGLNRNPAWQPFHERFGPSTTKYQLCFARVKLPVSELPTATDPGRGRIVAIDALRGLVMVLMALDHSRDFFGDVRIRPEDIDTTTPVLFFTRWVTHLCAPTFVFLAGVSAWIHGQKLEGQGQLSRFLITRGLWLLFLEFTVVRFGLLFAITLGPWMVIVIAAIGGSMVLLGVVCWLPDRAVLVLGVLLIAGHNLFDLIPPGQANPFGWLWTILLRPGYIP